MSRNDTTVLVVDDDSNICELLQLYLSRDGHRLLFAHNGSTALDIFRSEKPDLVILDIMLPIINGWEVCQLIRKDSDIPVIMLTARDASEDKVSGLDMGADDYVVKPFDPLEVAARVRAHLRKRKAAGGDGTADTLRVGGLVMDMEKYEVRLNGKPVELTPKETQLLHFMVLNKNIVLTRNRLLEKVWGYDYVGETRTVDMHVKKLREKLDSREQPWLIKTIYGVGYKFEVR
ncbi:phosphate regulon transcriptional regulatory protein PhoB [Desulfocucumis palustris]|uniref:Stage 0 sporulation protein A homolog n=1 Tax=Desulfocucumis palustris TaxID=1898651 RepID=A0A2L2XCS6_9FIRM|nr:response regulator transcription factor [Desulfocucumis palustris]GBF33804.1 phosphate regulon transcriptional regulatory protein PhoB [Desulfocucumis palustris]